MEFQAGKTYTTRSIVNNDTIISVTVLRRTAKTIYVKGDALTKEALRVWVFNGVERVSPWGKYSMSPVISAN
jgi:hypothetical protein